MYQLHQNRNGTVPK